MWISWTMCGYMLGNFNLTGAIIVTNSCHFVEQMMRCTSTCHSRVNPESKIIVVAPINTADQWNAVSILQVDHLYFL